jgi:hypothetical protein
MEIRKVRPPSTRRRTGVLELTANAHHATSVSTSEVQSVISSFDGLDSAVAVYGVAIPKHDGRAGCAGIPKAEFEKVDLGALAKHTKGKLPKYAVPVFIRVTEE